MKRRESLKYLSLSMGSLLSLPAWANGWNSDTVATQTFQMSPKNEALLAEIVETIIPTTDTAGAKTLGVHQFIQKIVADCLDKPSKDVFQQGLTMLDEQMKKNYSNSFVECSPQQRLEAMKKLEADKTNELSKFYGMVKGLTIQGYLSSEYVMVNHYNYKMIPDKYQPCISVNN